MEAARTFYHSPECQQIKPLRVENSDSQMVLVDGVAP
jgi:uncharacterized protein (DUF1330 family)